MLASSRPPAPASPRSRTDTARDQNWALARRPMCRRAGVSTVDTQCRTPLGKKAMTDIPETARSFQGTNSDEMTAAAASGKRPRLGWILGLTSAAYFMVVLDSLVVITALPRMQRDLHVGLASLQWTVNSYGIAFAAGIITAAALGDRLGRRKIFVARPALFTLASAACALAPSASALIAARAVQGLGGAAVLPLSLTILTAAFPAQRRGAIVGIYGGLAGLAVAIGPLVGGAVTEGLDWHWIFWVNVPIGVAVGLLALRLLPESHGAPARLGQRGDRRPPGRGQGPLGRLPLLGGRGARADAAPAAAPDPGLRRGKRDRVPHVRRDLRRRVLRRAVLPVRAGLLAAGHRGAAAALVRDPDARLAGRPGALRPGLAATGDRFQAAPAGYRLRLGRPQGVGRRGQPPARARAARGRRRHLDGPADRADRGPQRRRPGRDGEGLGHQQHDAALRRGVRDRDRQLGLRRERASRLARERHQRIQAGHGRRDGAVAARSHHRAGHDGPHAGGRRRPGARRGHGRRLPDHEVVPGQPWSARAEGTRGGPGGVVPPGQHSQRGVRAPGGLL